MINTNYTTSTTPVTSLDGGNTMKKDDFLQLLVTQLKYQDPLDPVKNEDMAAQLAQYSSLEELQNISSSIQQSTLASQSTTMAINSMLSTNLIGKSARSAPSMVYLEEGGTVDIPIRLADDAQFVIVNIFDENGDVIRTIEKTNLDEGQNFIVWDGKSDFGMTYPQGAYDFEVTAVDDLGNPIHVDPYVEGTVEGIAYEGSNIFYIIEGQRIPFGSITEINSNG